MRVLIVPDKFKGTLTAPQAAAALARGWKRVRAGDAVELLPMSDGGDGFGDVLSRLVNARRRTARTVNAARQPCRAHWWWEPVGRTAIVESARVIGLAMLPRAGSHPFQLDTFGLGKLLGTVALQKPRRCIVGLGGSATNDGGFGMARALGWTFLGRDGREIRAWTDLTDCLEVRPPAQRLRLGRLTMALDVRNPLLGRLGCTRVYGPQKGLGDDDLKPAEGALRQLASVMRRFHGNDGSSVPGAGAAGGLGFGLQSFLGATPAAGFDLFAREAGLDARLRRADLVLTGEGCLDRQSLMGKGVGALLARCERANVPCAAVCGTHTLPHGAQQRFAGTRFLTDRVSARQAMRSPARWLAQAASQLAEEASSGPSRRVG